MFTYPKQAQRGARKRIYILTEPVRRAWRQDTFGFRNTICSLNNRVAVTVFSCHANNFPVASNWIPHSPGGSIGPEPDSGDISQRNWNSV